MLEDAWKGISLSWTPCFPSRLLPPQRVAWLLACLALVACQPVGLERASLGDRPPPSANLVGVSFEGFSAGSREVRVRAARARLDPLERVVHLSGVRIQFEDEQRGEVKLNAATALLRLDSDDFVLQGTVEGQTASGETFITAEVRYDRAGERLWTDQPVEVQRAGLLLRGDGMEMDLSSHRLKLVGDVHVAVDRR